MERKDTTISTPHNEGDPAGPAPPKEGASFGGPLSGLPFIPACQHTNDNQNSNEQNYMYIAS
jgi:hypothetical protein